MKFLANENFPLDAVKAVRKISHDLAWIRRDAPGSKDHDILKRAVGEKPGCGRGSDLRPRDCRLRGASQVAPFTKSLASALPRQWTPGLRSQNRTPWGMLDHAGSWPGLKKGFDR